MDFTLIALAITLISGIALYFFLRRKATVLSSVEPYPIDLKPVINNVKAKVDKYNIFKDLVAVVLLEKMIMRLRVWIQKLENKTLHWLEHLRVNYKKEKPSPIFSADYWDNLKAQTIKQMTIRKKSVKKNSIETKPEVVAEVIEEIKKEEIVVKPENNPPQQ